MTAFPAPATPPPGWYPDPENGANVRWWDGALWTEHRTPVWQPPMAGPGPWGVGAPPSNHDLDWVLPVNCDGFAIAAGYLALFSIIPNPVTSIPAIAFGWIALKRIAQTGKRGKVRAVLGLVLGGCSLGLFALFMLMAALNSNGS